MEQVTVRPVRGHEWRQVRALRLQALQDEAAAIAFLATFDDAAARTEESWQEQTLRASSEAGARADVRQFVAIMAAGRWIGSVTVLVEQAGDRDYQGDEVRRSGGGVVGVYVDPVYRGTGVIVSLLNAALDWMRERGLEHSRLFVQADNRRAQRAYAKVGYRPSGVTLTGPIGPELEMVRDI